MFGINSWELVIVVIVALLVIGPERLPEYVAKMRSGIRDLKRLAEGAKTQLRDQMGPEFDDVDWSAYDPRQYDPRRIVREALADAWEEEDSKESPNSTIRNSAKAASKQSHGPGGAAPDGSEQRRTSPRVQIPNYTAVHDPTRPVPFDTDAT